MTPARILLLNPTAALGGAEYSLLDLAAGLDRRRFEPLLACTGDGPLVRAAEKRGILVQIVEVDARVARQSLKGTRSGALGLARAAAAAAPLAWRIRALAKDAAIVHSNGNKAHILAAAVGRHARLVWHVRDFWRDGAVERGMVRLANARAHLVIANSEAVASHLRQLGIQDGKVRAVPNGIDVNRFTPDGPRARLRETCGWPLDAPLIGIVGMLARWKGQHVLLKAFAEVLRRRPEARCVVAGDEIYVTDGQRGYGDELRRLARELKIDHAVAFAGYRTDVPALLRTFDVVVHASTEPEPFGRVVAEAMACARPVIATEAGGIPEVTGPNGLAALLVPCGDDRAMAGAIERLLEDRAEAARMGAAGRERIVTTFPVSAHVDRVQALYHTLLEPTASQAAWSGIQPGSAR